jgi:hypothetical protein
MNKTISSHFIIISTIILFSACGQSKNERVLQAKLDSIAKRDSIANSVRKIRVDMSNRGLRLDSIIISNNTRMKFELLEGEVMMIIPPGTEQSYFIKDTETGKEFNMIAGEGVKFQEWITGPLKFELVFEKLDANVKKINLIGGKNPGNYDVTGIYQIQL